MEVKINCKKCGAEHTYEVKVPQFCSKECRVAEFKAMVASRRKLKEVSPETGEVQA